jgi:hypothetical protein
MSGRARVLFWQSYGHIVMRSYDNGAGVPLEWAYGRTTLWLAGEYGYRARGSDAIKTSGV